MTDSNQQAQAGLRGFQDRKENALGKRDKSNAGRIDPRAVDICAAINERAEYFTTSSCAGRCLLYRGDGIKSHHHFAPASENTGSSAEQEKGSGDSMQGHGYFERFRVSHDIVRDPKRYFNMTTLDKSKDNYDPSGGGDPVRSVGQFEHLQMQKDGEESTTPTHLAKSAHVAREGAIWLRFEPFILHVMCRSLSAASALMAAARPSLKNVGLTSFKDGYGRYVVAVWGDEGLDMPLTAPDDPTTSFFLGREEWLATLVNERHKRNWAKIERFVENVRAMPDIIDEVDGWSQVPSLASPDFAEGGDNTIGADTTATPKRFDVVGDVAILNTMPPGDEKEREAVGKAIMKRNKAIKVCVARSSALSGTERAPGEALVTIAGARRKKLITTHQEYGIKCVVDLENSFFSPRMGPERLRICQQVARGEKVLVLFSGVGMDALQIAGRTEAESVISVELNAAAVSCARLGQRMLERNKAVKTLGAAERLKIMEGDAMDILPTLELESFDRIVAPRPKEGALDGDLGTGDGGMAFLELILPLMKPVGGELHWYDFAADVELPTCERTKDTLERGCDSCGLSMEVIHVAQVGSIAKRQFRVCMDIRLTGKK